MQLSIPAARQFAIVWAASWAWKIAALLILFVLVAKLYGGS